MIKTDSKGNEYIEKDMFINQFVRITRVKDGWDGGATIRISIKDENGKVRQGPEFPISLADDVINAINTLK